MIRALLARLLARPAKRDRWMGSYASFAEACAGGRAVPYSALAQQPAYIDARLDPAGAASGMREAEALDSKHQGLLSALTLARCETRGPFHVVDFGGGLGLHHRALAKRLELGPADHWTVVELPAVCAAGRARAANDGLAFVESLEQVSATPAPSVVLASGVMNALEDPTAMLRAFARMAPWVVLGSLPLVPAAAHRVAINTTHQTPYPLWFFSDNQLLADVSSMGLRVRARWPITETHWLLDGRETPPATGLLLQR
ncbi:MAG: methyltransferase, TIGR04325 family [Betaproteobacteria bacterium]